jgi:hypothetical protein
MLKECTKFIETREGLEISTLIPKEEEYPPLDLMKISRYTLIQTEMI